MKKPSDQNERVVTPPPPTDPAVPHRVQSVTLRPGERVQWEWTTLPDGRRFVSGYTILPAWRAPRDGPHGAK